MPQLKIDSTGKTLAQGPKAMRILAVEDDMNLVNALRTVLKDDYALDAAPSAPKALSMMNEQTYELLLVDEHLDEGTGLDVIRHIRKLRNDVPVVVMTGQANKQLAIDCVNLGVNRFLEKPFELSDLRSTIADLLSAPETLSIGPGLTLRRDRRQIEHDGTALKLTPLQFRIVEYLIENKGRCISRTELREKLWGKAELSRNALDTHLTGLRKMAPQVAAQVRLSRGLGYWWDFDRA